MTTKVVNPLIFLSFFVFAVFSFTSCENEIDSIGVGIIDNGNFDTDSFEASIVSESENVERVISSNISQYLLGVYKDNEFGKLSGSVVSQLSLPTYGESYALGYGDDVVVDSVLLNIPYQVTIDAESDTPYTAYTLDSIIGTTDTEFELGVYELKTFLNTLDPTDPSKNNVYYSDKEFQKGNDPFFLGAFNANPSDTVAYIKRYEADGITVYDTDTIKEDNLQPSIKIPLNKNMVRQLFVDNPTGPEFSSADEFVKYFRGFYLEANAYPSNEYSHLMSLNFNGANMTIYYSNVTDESETQDLNGNGTQGESNVRVKRNYVYNFGNLKSNILERDYSVEKSSGPERIYVQGAAGSIGVLDILSQEDLDELRSNNWLINSANLTVYVDQNAVSSIAPEQLFLFNYDDREHLLDVLTEGINSVGGTLQRDEDGKPEKYVFKITDYISELLVSEEPESLVRLGLKVYGPTDVPANINDVSIKEYSWNPKGVVLFNDDESAGDKKISLEIFYTELKQ